MLKPRHIGFVSTRLSGTDGVSLEARKWVEVLEGDGHECFFFAGELDCPRDHEYVAPEAHFMHPVIKDVQAVLFGTSVRSPSVSQTVHEVSQRLKEHLYNFVRTYNLEALVVQNALAIPMNVPLGLALTEFANETRMPIIAHHHDFYWERERFLRTAVADYLRAAFPPTTPNLRHVTINSVAASELGLRAGVSSIVVPNVMNFTHMPQPGSGRVDVRRRFDIADSEIIVLQPTRVVKRKRIERAIECVHQLQRPAVLLVSHPAGDEGTGYLAWLRSYADRLGVRIACISDQVALDVSAGNERLTLQDLYAQADIVTYPSSHEGFGNAFIEAVYYKKPLLVNRYPIYRTDIAPKGFQVVEIEDVVTKETVDAIDHVLTDGTFRANMVEHNYALGRRHYSYEVLRRHLRYLLSDLFGEDVSA